MYYISFGKKHFFKTNIRNKQAILTLITKIVCKMADGDFIGV